MRECDIIQVFISGLHFFVILSLLIWTFETKPYIFPIQHLIPPSSANVQLLKMFPHTYIQNVKNLKLTANKWQRQHFCISYNYVHFCSTTLLH